ncbi:MAG: helix-turn-helix transcriptional regulator [Clostridia bacterium]|nr:helix-turn-helix transcriptional regulator [Clostridia bacterium]
MIVYQSENSSRPYNCDITHYEDFSYVAHLHKDLELVYVEHGTVRMTVENRVTELSPGDFALILPSQIHSYLTVGEHSTALVIVFAEEYVPEFCRALSKKTAETNRFRMNEEDSAFLLRKLRAIRSIESERILLSACFSLATAAFLSEVPLAESTGESKSNLLLHRMLFYVSEHFRENITLDGMARALGYETHYISRCFHTHLDKNFKQFVNEYRINYAKLLISGSADRMTMTEIAFASGFQSVRNFNRAYKSIEGTEPRQHIR